MACTHSMFETDKKKLRENKDATKSLLQTTDDRNTHYSLALTRVNHMMYIVQHTLDSPHTHIFINQNYKAKIRRGRKQCETYTLSREWPPLSIIILSYIGSVVILHKWLLLPFFSHYFHLSASVMFCRHVFVLSVSFSLSPAHFMICMCKTLHRSGRLLCLTFPKKTAESKQKLKRDHCWRTMMMMRLKIDWNWFGAKIGVSLETNERWEKVWAKLEIIAYLSWHRRLTLEIIGTVACDGCEIEIDARDFLKSSAVCELALILREWYGERYFYSRKKAFYFLKFHGQAQFQS